MPAFSYTNQFGYSCLTLETGDCGNYILYLAVDDSYEEAAMSAQCEEGTIEVTAIKVSGAQLAEAERIISLASNPELWTPRELFYLLVETIIPPHVRLEVEGRSKSYSCHKR